jgi:hypothetical protein
MASSGMNAKYSNANATISRLILDKERLERSDCGGQIVRTPPRRMKSIGVLLRQVGAVSLDGIPSSGSVDAPGNFFPLRAPLNALWRPIQHNSRQGEKKNRKPTTSKIAALKAMTNLFFTALRLCPKQGW